MMMKSKIYKGIEYIQVSELPQNQSELFATTFNKSLVIKILINGKVINDCLQFTDYKTWYESIYNIHSVIEIKPAIVERIEAIPTEINQIVLVNG